jgi:hypothetical protein
VQPAETRADDQHIGLQTVVQSGMRRDWRRQGTSVVARHVLGRLREHARSRENLRLKFHEKISLNFHASKGGNPKVRYSG